MRSRWNFTGLLVLGLGSLLGIGMLAGCGSNGIFPGSAGGGAGGSSVNGVFADGPVVGLSYSCGGQTGVTGAGGTFTCPAKSTVTFSVGGIVLCTAPAQALMTPVSCAQATDVTANTSTPSVLALGRFLMSISTTPAASGTLTITAAELQAAANLSLNFATATDAQLLAAVQTINSGAPLVAAATAQNELNGTVIGALAGNYAGSYSGGSSGTWTVAISANGVVSGSFNDSSGKSGPIAGNLVNGTTYQGTAGSATWTGNLDTSQTPHVFSGKWNDSNINGTFTGHN